MASLLQLDQRRTVSQRETRYGNGSTAIIFTIALVSSALIVVGFAPAQLPLYSLGSYGWRIAALIISLACLAGGVKWALARRFTLLLAPWLMTLLAEFFIRPTDISALSDLAKNVFLISVGALIAGAWAAPLGRRLITLLMVSVLVGIGVLLLIYCAVLIGHGWSWQAARVFKMQSIAGTGFGANTACFAATLLMIPLSFVARQSKILIFALGTTIVAASVLLAARTPILAFPIAGLLGWLLAKFWRVNFVFWSPLKRVILVLGFLGPLLTAFLLFVPSLNGISIAGELAGRAAIWQIGMDVWLQHPLVGAGSEAFPLGTSDSLAAGTFHEEFRRTAFVHMTSGGFHNIWINTLAERGLLGAAGILLSYALLMGIAHRRKPAAYRDFRYLLAHETLLFYVFLRSFFEIAGLMSYANSPLDLVVMVAIACTTSAVAQEPDRRMANQGRCP